MTAALVTALLVFGAAAEDSPAFQELFEEGVELYRDLEFEDAVSRFEEAAAIEEASNEERAHLLVWVAMCRAGVGDDDGARQALRHALDLDAEPRLPEVAPPKVARFVSELQEERAAAAVEPAAPEPAPAPVEPPASEVPVMLVAGGATAGVGAVALAGAGLFSVLAALSLDEARKPDAFQSDAVSALGSANLQAATAGVLGLSGALLLGSGAALLAFEPLFGE